LVGGHCIGVDPYYLTHKSESVGYRPEMILAGRRINDGMGSYVVSQLIKKMINKKIEVSGSRVLVMGLTFKENCPDMRNTKVIDVISELSQFGCDIDCYDPWVNEENVKQELKINQVKYPAQHTYDAIILAVSHDEFIKLGSKKIREFGKENHILYDLKYLFPKNQSDFRL
jgi:UDP-N-acetyl-D-galactosamine dehydrogenase